MDKQSLSLKVLRPLPTETQLLGWPLVFWDLTQASYCHSPWRGSTLMVFWPASQRRSPGPREAPGLLVWMLQRARQWELWPFGMCFQPKLFKERWGRTVRLAKQWKITQSSLSVALLWNLQPQPPGKWWIPEKKQWSGKFPIWNGLGKEWVPLGCRGRIQHGKASMDGSRYPVTDSVSQ